MQGNGKLNADEAPLVIYVDLGSGFWQKWG